MPRQNILLDINKFILKYCGEIMDAIYESSRTPVNYIELLHCPTHCDPHYHQSVEIVVALNSEVETHINTEGRVLRPGEIAVADSFDVHSFDSFGKDVFILILPKEYLAEYMSIKGKLHLKTPFICDKKTTAAITSCIRGISKTESRLTQLGYAYAIMGLVCESCGLSDKKNADIELMQKVLDFLETHSDEDITLCSLSDRFGYSKYYFSRMFNDFFKFNLNEYLARLRIKNFLSAMRLDPSADITDTALDCGFNSQQTFYRCFTKYYGISPKAYLKTPKK